MSSDELLDEEFIQWLKSNNVQIESKIQAAEFPGGLRGIKATSTIYPNEVILRVPRQALFTTELVKTINHPALNDAIQKNKTMPPTTLLGIILLYEMSKGTDSSWWPYLNSMPRSYSTLLYFSDEEIKSELQLDYAIHKAYTSQETAQEQHIKYALPCLKSLGLSGKWCSLQAWNWASSSISSRTMFVPYCEAGALTPFGDLHNHQSPPPPYTLAISLLPKQSGDEISSNSINGREHGEWGDGRYHEIKREYQIIARRKYSAGEQVYLCYGRHDNLTLLDLYGFSLPDNPHDIAVLPLANFHPKFAAKLGELSIIPSIHHDGSPSWDLLRELRLFLSSPEERKSLAYLAVDNKPINSRVEAKVWQVLTSVCEKTLSALKTTVEQDEKMLDMEEMSETKTAAIEWRLGYKKILKRCIELKESSSMAGKAGVI